ncbi:hypothetical protein [Pseudarthrobacter sp. NS4]|uniref:hypothetical protein n=1 Tax=Pseudarthrobacter sp. NS4 TaxID=2973976 RepID=UPI002163C2DB|nr:hypothetical protein [Pseudarthrobacter sp. NS4]
MPLQDGEPAGPAAVRLFSGFAVFGAGSVNLAVSSSFFAGAAGAPGPAEYAAGGIAGLWGAVLLSAAVVYLVRGSFPDSRTARSVLMVAAAAHAAAIAISTPSASGLNLSHLAALLLTLMIIAAVAWLRRNTGRHQAPGTAAPPAGQPGWLLLAAFAGAVLVAGITTPGLAASTAGQFAVPHGEHDSNAPPGGHHPR